MDTVPTNNVSAVGTVPTNNVLAIGTVPTNNAIHKLLLEIEFLKLRNLITDVR